MWDIKMDNVQDPSKMKTSGWGCFLIVSVRRQGRRNKVKIIGRMLGLEKDQFKEWFRWLTLRSVVLAYPAVCMSWRISKLYYITEVLQHLIFLFFSSAGLTTWKWLCRINTSAMDGSWQDALSNLHLRII